MRILRLLFWFLPLWLCAQFPTGSPSLFSIVFPPADSIFLHHAPIVAESVRITPLNAGTLPPYEVFSARGLIVFTQNPADSVRVTYRSFPFNLNESLRDSFWIFLRRPDTIPDWEKEHRMIEFSIERRAEPLLGDPAVLRRSGSLTRGIAFGNARDASFQSAFNLQLSGEIGDGIEIAAAITDENIPVQPDGNTLQLQDFDKVYITLKKDATLLTAGDYQLQRPDGYFLQINKRAQGLMLETAVPNVNLMKGLPKGQWRTRNAGAVARGKFKRQEFNGVEGNQGPYRLTGNQGETFILILSGSESVFLDGVRLTRGIEHDYVIDYNSAEITFTSKRMITKDSRIVVEFEYSDRNYQRWMLFSGNRWDLGNVHVRFNFFTEFDDKNTPVFQTLNDSDRIVLSMAGDHPELAAVSGAELMGYSSDEVRYRRVDSLVQGQVYTVFVHSQDPMQAVWRVRFSYVGPGKGHYEPAASTANGRVYAFVAPGADGKPAGSYEPQMRLVPPQTQRMLTLGSGGKVGKYTRFDVEGALSHFDKNTFSDIDSGDDQDYGFVLSLNDRRPLSQTPRDSLLLVSSVRYEQVGANFQPFIRFRNVEFERDWNRVNRNNPNEVLQLNPAGTDYILSVGIGLHRSRIGLAEYRFERYIKGLDFDGMRHAAHFQLKHKGWEWKHESSYTSTADSSVETQFLRSRFTLQKGIKGWGFQLSGNDEINPQRNRNSGELLRSAYAFHEYGLSLGKTDSLKNNWEIFYRLRLDRMSDTMQMRTGAIAHVVGANSRFFFGKNYRLNLNLSFRNLEIPDSSLSTLKPEQTMLTRGEFNGKFLKQTLSLDMFYETGAGLENRRAYQFIVALNGMGDYVWIDYNGNGLRERDEFELRSGSLTGTDGFTYLKVFVPGNEYIKTYYNRLTANLQWKAPAAWKNSGNKTLRFLHRWSMQTTWRSDLKTQDVRHAFNPWPASSGDTAMIARNFNFRQSIYFNRFGGKLGLEFSHQDIRQLQYISGGAEARETQTELVRLRFNPVDLFGIQSEFRYGWRISRAELLRNREYNIEFWEVAPRLIIQPGTRYRISLIYRAALKTNRPYWSGGNWIDAGEQGWMHRPGLEFKWNDPGKGSLEARVEYVYASFSGSDLNSPLRFEMLESLDNGHNFTWGLVFQRSLGGNLQLSLTYDGRKTRNGPVIHLGGAQLRAYF